MKLLIVRHAVAMEREDWNDLGKPDELRPLTKKGIKDFSVAAKSLVKLVPKMEVIYTSQLIRAIQTAEILAKNWPKAQLEMTEQLNHWASVDEAIQWVSQLKAQEVCLVGHEPWLSTFIQTLLWKAPGAQSAMSLSKGGAALLEGKKGQMQLRFLLTRKQLLSLA